MNVSVEVQNASGIRSVPLRRQFSQWASIAMRRVASHRDKYRLSIRIVDEEESAQLNSQYRGKPGPTNILSFPTGDDVGLDGLLGDLAICAPVVIREAAEQNKSIDSHWAHLVVHGVLHLAGYDHEKHHDAEKMEALEVSILRQMGIGNPYLA